MVEGVNTLGFDVLRGTKFAFSGCKKLSWVSISWLNWTGPEMMRLKQTDKVTGCGAAV